MDIEKQINIASYLVGLLPRGKVLGTGEYSVNCPFHEDKHSSFSINTESGLWKCYVPNCEGFSGGNLTQLVAAIKKISPEEAFKKIAQDNGIEVDKKVPPELSEKKIQEYNLELLGNKPVLDALYTKYHYTNETIAKFKLGWTGTRISIPIYDDKGNLVNIRKKPLDSGRCMGIEQFNEMRLFPIRNLENDKIYLFEGEKDCMLACQLGLNAMSVTSGAGSFNQEWLPLFKDKSVYICYDIDEAGVAGAVRVKDLLIHITKELKIVALPITEPPNGDFTDFISQGHTVEEFEELVDGIGPEEKLVKERVRISDYVYPTELSRAADAEFYFKRVCFNIIVSGKDTQPYLPPKEIELSCPMGQKFCKYCGLMPFGGKYTLKLNHLSADILQWVDCTEEHHNVLIRKNMELPDKCHVWKSFVSEAQTVEEVTLIPEISYAVHDTEYVVRTAYVIGKKVKSNCNYKLEAVTIPHPATQAATHLVYAISENHTAIDHFEMTENLMEELKVFQVVLPGGLSDPI